MRLYIPIWLSINRGLSPHIVYHLLSPPKVQRKHVYNLRQVILSGDSESCSDQIFQYMQAVADEIVLLNIDPQKPPKTWNQNKD
jgi:hypothetical protein